jgi:hypothetical protein
MPASEPGSPTKLIAVKTVHTVVWAFFVASIIAVPVSAANRRYDLAATFAGIVLVEILILLFNRWQCPLTAVAARYTADRRANFDIFLPEWLARYNKEIFGTLFVFGLLFALARWMGWLG